MSQLAHKPADRDRNLVRTLSGLGVPQDNICSIVGIAKATLHKHYREEMDRGMAEANAKVAESLFKQATENGNVGAAIFWLKARAGWRETAPEGGAEQLPIAIQINIVNPQR